MSKTTQIKTLTKDLNNTIKKIAKIIDKLKSEILSLPQNSKIRFISTNAFIVSSKDLGGNWSPIYHNYKHQYELIVKLIETKSAEDVLPFLNEIIKKGKIKISPTQKEPLHPDVIKFLKNLIKE